MKTQEFFETVRTGRVLDLDVYSKVQEMTDNFDETKLNLLCKDFDFYLFMAKEEWLGSFSKEEIQNQIKKFHEEDRKIPTFGDQSFNQPEYISGHFKTPEHKKIIKEEDYTEEQLKNIEEIGKKWGKDKKKILDTEKLMDPHGVEFFSLYKLRNLLIDLKRKHTSAVYKFDEKPKDSFSPFEHNASPEKSQTFKFFESVNSGEILKLDIHNRIQELTDDYDEDKLNLLCSEFDSYIFVKYENWRDKYTKEDIEKRIATYQEKGIKLPKKEHKNSKHRSPFIRDFFLHERYGKPVSDKEYDEYMSKIFGKSSDNVIDDNVLLGGFYVDSRSMPLLHLRDILIDLKRKHTSSVYRFDDKPEDLQTNNNYIDWLNDDTLEQFIEALIDQKLIEEREPQDIIKDHFEPVRKQNREPEPIEWLNTQSLLAYMIDQLDETYIQTSNIWKDTAPHFSVNGQTPKNLRQSAKGYRDNQTGRNGGMIGKPKNHQLIDDILQHLPE